MTSARWTPIETKRKRRKSPRALRFAEIKVGDQLMRKPTESWWRGIAMYFVVSDIWFDPVAGQDDPIRGQMIGVQQLDENGEPRKHKSAYPVRGLASQQFHYADMDYIAHCKARASAKVDGAVVSIQMGDVIRRRPKIPGSSL